MPSALAPRFDDMSILTLNDEEDLGRIVDRHGIVVIDFWAPWCAPCRGFLPILEKASESHPEIAFCRVNTEENKELAQAFEVKSIPTLVVIRERIMIASQPGNLPAEKLDELLGKVRQVDMDAVRRDMAQEQTGPAAES